MNQNIYHNTVKGMLSKQNEDIIHGRDVKLNHHKEDKDHRELLERLFTLTDDEMNGIDARLNKLATWCTGEEARLLQVAPEQRPLDLLGNKVIDQVEVAGPTPDQGPALEYKPLIDVSELKGETAADAREAMKEADELITSGAKRGFEGFRVES